MAGDVVADLVAQLRLAVDQQSFNRGAKAADILNRKLGDAAPKVTGATRAITGLGVVGNQALGGLAAQSAVAQASLTGLGAAGVSSTAALGIGLGVVAAGAAAKFALTTAQMASAVEEQLNGVRVTFGDAAESVEAFASSAADSYAIAEVDALKAANQLGGIFKAFGTTSAEAAKFSTEIVALSGDLASFKDIAPEEALLALRAGLVGEAEPLRRLGVTLSEATTQAKALELGLVGPGEKLTDLDKITARYALITEQTADAQGDFARTSDSLANQQRTLTANLKDLGAEIGEHVLPAITDLTSGVVGLVNAMEDIGKNKVVQAAGDTIGLLMAGFGTISTSTQMLEEAQNKGTESTEKFSRAAAIQAEAARTAARALDEATNAANTHAEAVLKQVDAHLSLEGAKDALEGATEDVAEAEQELSDIVNVQGDVLEKVENATRALEDAQQELTDAQLTLAEATDKEAGAQRELNEAMATEGVRALRAVEEATLDLDRARNKQRDSAEDLAEAEKALAEAIKTGASPNEIREREEAVEDARLDVREANINVPVAEEALTEAQRQQRMGTDELLAASDASVAAIQAVDAAHRGVEDASRRVQDATEGLTEVLAKVGPNSDAAREATEKLSDANRDATEADHALADANVRLAEATAAVEGRTFTAKDALAIYSESLATTDGAADRLRKQLVGINHELEQQIRLAGESSKAWEAAQVAAATISPLAPGLSNFVSGIAALQGTAAMPGPDAPGTHVGTQINGPITVQANDPNQMWREIGRQSSWNRVGSPP